jgi:DNA-binding transcriptional LysR family regulator
MGAVMQLSDRIGNRMKLQDLHVLMTVVQAGSMGKAAQILNTTQPNVSRSIGELEQALAFACSTPSQGIEPTEYGRALLDCGAAVFDDLRQGVKNIAFLADPTAGELRIGTTTFLAASFVSALVDRLSRRYPRIVFHLVTGYTETLHRELAERNVDLLIIRGSGPIADPRYDFEFLFDDSYVRAGTKSRVRRRRIEIAELVNELWVLPPPESVIGSIVMDAFRASGLDYPRVSVVTDCPHMRISLLATGRFVTIFPASAFRFLAKRSELKILPVELPTARRPNGIVTLKNRALSPVAQLFIHSARELAKPNGEANMIDSMSA